MSEKKSCKKAIAIVLLVIAVVLLVGSFIFGVPFSNLRIVGSSDNSGMAGNLGGGASLVIEENPNLGGTEG